MKHLVDTPDEKKKHCKHKYKPVFPQGSKKKLEVCINCNNTRIPKIKKSTNSLSHEKSNSKTLVLACKQSIMLGVIAFVTKWNQTNWKSISYDGWKLPATKSQYSWCGVWHIIGCLNSRLHRLLGKGKLVYVKKFQKSCYRGSCCICYVKWITREALSARNRFSTYLENHQELRGKKPRHFIFLPPPSQYNLGYDKLKEKLMDVLKILEYDGGIFFHPFAPDRKSEEWEKRPHFHGVGFSNVEIAKAFGKHGWYVKDCGERKILFKLFCYLLSHCGIKKGKHSIVWVGKLSYRKLKSKKEKKITSCPLCNGKFGPVTHEGPHPIVPPDEPYEGALNDDGKWHG